MSKKCLALRVLDKIFVEQDISRDFLRVSGPDPDEATRVFNDISAGHARVVNHFGHQALLYVQQFSSPAITSQTYGTSPPKGSSPSGTA